MFLANANDPEENANAEWAIMVLLIEEPNLRQNLRLTQQQQEWYVALKILRALGQVYDLRGRWAEFRSLRQSAFSQVGKNLKEAKTKGLGAFDFWMYLRGVDAFEAVRQGNPEKARAINQEILDELIALNDPSMNNEIAVAYTNLGMAAREKRDFETAFNYYQNALKIYQKDKGDSSRAAAIYYEMGLAAQGQGNFPLATHYFQKALKTYQEVKDIYRIAGIYHQLGTIARLQHDFKNATFYFEKSVKIIEEIGDRYLASGTYHELGQLAKEQGNLELATNYYYTSLQIYEDRQDLYNASDEYHCLGEIAKIKGNFDDAIAYFEKAFEIRSAAKDWYKVAATLMEWGKTLEAQENWIKALRRYIQTFIIDDQHNHNQMWIAEDIEALGRMLKQLGETSFEAIWREVTGGECDGDMRAAIWSARDNLETE